MARTPGFKERLSQMMERAGLNQSDLARRLGIKPQSVQGWVSGDSEPRGYRFEKLAQILGVSEEWLRTGVDNPWGVQEAPQDYGLDPEQGDKWQGGRMKSIRDERRWWEESVRARVVEARPDLAAYFDKAIDIQKRTRFRLDFLSPKLAAEMKIAQAGSPIEPTHRARETLWRLAVLQAIGDAIEVNRRYVLYLLWAEEPTAETSRFRDKTEDLQWEAEELGLEVKTVSGPEEVADDILATHGP